MPRAYCPVTSGNHLAHRIRTADVYVKDKDLMLKCTLCKCDCGEYLWYSLNPPTTSVGYYFFADPNDLPTQGITSTTYVINSSTTTLNFTTDHTIKGWDLSVID